MQLVNHVCRPHLRWLSTEQHQEKREVSCNLTRQAACTAPPTQGAAADLSQQAIDVSVIAESVLFYGHVVMDVEAFVTVSRRAGADGTNLTPYERTRLLDVLCHAQCFRQNSDTSECTFPVWLASSDAEDSRARTHWFAMKRNELGVFVIRLSDL